MYEYTVHAQSVETRQVSWVHLDPWYPDCTTAHYPTYSIHIQYTLSWPKSRNRVHHLCHCCHWRWTWERSCNHRYYCSYASEPWGCRFSSQYVQYVWSMFVQCSKYCAILYCAVCMGLTLITMHAYILLLLYYSCRLCVWSTDNSCTCIGTLPLCKVRICTWQKLHAFYLNVQCVSIAHTPLDACFLHVRS